MCFRPVWRRELRRSICAQNRRPCRKLGAMNAMFVQLHAISNKMAQVMVRKYTAGAQGYEDKVKAPYLDVFFELLDIQLSCCFLGIAVCDKIGVSSR